VWIGPWQLSECNQFFFLVGNLPKTFIKNKIKTQCPTVIRQPLRKHWPLRKYWDKVEADQLSQCQNHNINDGVS